MQLMNIGIYDLIWSHGNMKNLPIIILIVIALLLGFAGGWLGGSRSSPPMNDTIIFQDTIIDTIPYRQPVPVDSVILRYVPVKLPIADTIFTQGAEIVKVDSVFVEVPIQQKEYKDSTYQAWVSGFNVNLDSINVFNKTITVTHRIREPPKRWGLGLHVGAGYYGTDRKIGPYIGVGISYNILTW